MFVLSLASDEAKKVPISSDEQLLARIQRYFPDLPDIELNTFVWEAFPGNKQGFLLVSLANWVAAGLPTDIIPTNKFNLTIYDSNDITQTVVFNDLSVQNVQHIQAPLSDTGNAQVDNQRFVIVEIGQSLGVIDEPKYYNIPFDWMPNGIYANSYVGSNPSDNIGPVFPDTSAGTVTLRPFAPSPMSNRDFITYCANIHCATAYVPRDASLPVLTNARRDINSIINTQNKRLIYSQFLNNTSSGRLHLAVRDFRESVYQDRFITIALGDKDSNFSQAVVATNEVNNFVQYYPFYRPISSGTDTTLGVISSVITDNSTTRCSTYYEIRVQGLLNVVLANNLRKITYRLNRSHIETVLENDQWKPYDPGIRNDSTISIVQFELLEPIQEANVPVSAKAITDTSNELTANAVFPVLPLANYQAPVGVKGVAYKDNNENYIIIELFFERHAFLAQGVIGVRSDVSTSDSKHVYGAHADEQIVKIQSESTFNISPAPYNIFEQFDEAQNPLKLNGVSGDPAIFLWDAYEEQWTLFAVIPQKALVFFRLTEDRPSGLGSIAVAATALAWRGSGEGPLQVVDRFGVAINAKENQEGIAEWNQKHSEWTIVACDHLATDVRGVVLDRASAGSSNVIFQATVGYDGGIESDDPKIGLNLAGWEYPGPDKLVWCKLNPLTYEWEIYQLECP